MAEIAIKPDRLEYLGKTPSKDSATGQAVIQRMCLYGRITCAAKTTAQRGQCACCDLGDVRQFKDRRTQQFHNIRLADMGHYPVAAVTYWNEQGRRSEPRSETVRDWMLDPSNYDLELSVNFVNADGKTILGNRARGGGSDKYGNRLKYKKPYKRKS
jgi:hypothetical protein